MKRERFVTIQLPWVLANVTDDNRDEVDDDSYEDFDDDSHNDETCH